MSNANKPGPQRFVKRLGVMVIWQAAGKILQIAGAAYAFRCLGPENVGLTGTILILAAFVLILFDFGLERVAVRAIARRPEDQAELTRAIFSLRVMIGLGVATVWMLAALWVYGLSAVGLVWLLGAVFLFNGFVVSNWFFEATDRIPLLTGIQTGLSLTTSLAYLIFFRPGQAVGSDLLVMTVLAVLITCGIIRWMGGQIGCAPFSLKNLRRATTLLKEGQANWWFSLQYCVLSTMTLPLCYWLVGEQEGGWFRAAAALVAAIQLFLNNFAYMLNPRIVRWHAEDPALCRRRLQWLTLGVITAGTVFCAGLWCFRVAVTDLLYGEEFLPSADSLPILVLAKFFALCSGCLVWGVLAAKRDVLVAKACVLPLGGAVLLHSWLIPAYGITGGAWANLGAEVLLFVGCFVTFTIVFNRARSSDA